jgi:hypothetical protein
MAFGIVHCLALKSRSGWGGFFASCGRGPLVALVNIEVVVYVAVKMFRAMEPRPSADEYAACKPFGAVTAIRSAATRRSVVVAVRAGGRVSDADRHLAAALCGVPRKRAAATAGSAKYFNVFIYLPLS